MLTTAQSAFLKGVRLFALAALTWPACAQFELGGRTVEVHGFASQGFAYSNDNNYLTMHTSTGSFAFTDGGLNVSTQLTNRFRVGAQLYDRSIGTLGRGQLKLDWALGDYRFSDGFGVRAGKVKTVLGLYNDTQDVQSLQTWAILPQSVYPLDLRETSLSHAGADAYGRFSIPHLGNLAYTFYAGSVDNDKTGGYVYALRGLGLNSAKTHGSAEGGDVKWTTPLPGLLVGASFLNSHLSASGSNLLSIADIGSAIPFHVMSSPDHRTVLSGQYTFHNLRVDGEYSRDIQGIRSSGIYLNLSTSLPYLVLDRRGWYVSGAYRLTKRLEVGSYYSRFFPNSDQPHLGLLPVPPEQRHVFDKTFTARVLFTNHLDLKVEGHLIDGHGDSTFGTGFYLQQNPQGFQPRTNLLVLRMGFSF